MVVQSQIRVEFWCHVLSGFILNWQWIHLCLWYLLTFPELVLHVCFIIIYHFLYLLRRAQLTRHDAIRKCHQLHPCTQVDIWVIQQTRFYPKTFIPPVSGLPSVHLQLKGRCQSKEIHTCSTRVRHYFFHLVSSTDQGQQDTSFIPSVS